MSPLVSIIIPCYNAEAYVNEAIESALNQSYPHKEVIVIDDGSTDGSLNVIRQYGNALRWETQDNKGSQFARNHGIELAQGDFIQFLDADDFIDDEKIASQLSKAVKTTSDIVFCDGVIVDEKGKERFLTLERGTGTNIRFTLENWLTIEGPLYPSKTLRAIGGLSPDLTVGQDWELQVRLACAGYDFIRYPRSLFRVNKRVGSLSSGRCLELCEVKFATVQRCIQTLNERDVLSESHRREFAAFLAFLGRRYLRVGGSTDIAKTFFRRAKEVHPNGGLSFAYPPVALHMYHCFGPVMTEALVKSMARIRNALRKSQPKF